MASEHDIQACLVEATIPTLRDDCVGRPNVDLGDELCPFRTRTAWALTVLPLVLVVPERRSRRIVVESTYKDGAPSGRPVPTEKPGDSVEGWFQVGDVLAATVIAVRRTEVSL